LRKDFGVREIKQERRENDQKKVAILEMNSNVPAPFRKIAFTEKRSEKE